MSNLNKKIPFGWCPASWGLTGDSRTRAEIEYNFDGIDRRRMLAKVGITNKYKMALVDLEIDFDIGLINEYEFDIKKLEHEELNSSGADKDKFELRRLVIKLQHEKITVPDYNKKRATLLHEPYVECLEMGFDHKNPHLGAFELDWNDEFVQLLHENNYVGKTDEEVVNDWFNTICKSVVAQNIADQDFGLEKQNTTGRSDVEIIRDPPPTEKEGDNITVNTSNEN